MEGNKDEAEKCRLLAEKFLKEGDKEKAVKFLKKADRLYPTKQVKGECFSLTKRRTGGLHCINTVTKIFSSMISSSLKNGD